LRIAIAGLSPRRSILQTRFDERFPDAFIGTVVRFNDSKGDIQKSPNPDWFEFIDHRTGEVRKLKLASSGK
jgi:hypothetical protein